MEEFPSHKNMFLIYEFTAYLGPNRPKSQAILEENTQIVTDHI
jgi:hypothetical protein